MSQDKPLFGSRDPGPVTTGVADATGKKYVGQERRRDNRRKAQDRREDVRFDLDKSDRRQKSGRRDDDDIPTFW